MITGRKIASGNSGRVLLPGRKTHEGYSAVVTVRAQLDIDANNLRDTFPKLAIADLVDQLAPILRGARRRPSQRQ